jgi:hypothetical protein
VDEGWQVLSVEMPTGQGGDSPTPPASPVLRHYRYPERRFLQLGESRLILEH